MKTERMRLKLERKYYPLILAALEGQISSFKSAYEKDPASAVSDINLQVWNEDLLRVFTDLYKEVYPLFAEATFVSVKKEAMKLRLMGQNKKWTQDVVVWLIRFGLNLVSTISGNSRDLLLGIVNKAIQEGVEEGIGFVEVTKRILSRLGDQKYTYTKFRAMRIARTETIRAANEGHMAGARDLPFLVSKVWVAANDERTRRIPRDQYDHVELDGVMIDLEDPFTSTSKDGITISARQPGDVTAPPGFTINCRCRVAFEPKRDSNDRLIMKNSN